MSVEPVPPIGTGRCGCASDKCSCKVQSSSTISVIGTGDPNDPMSFVSLANRIWVSVTDTPSVDLTLTGGGTFANPYVLTGTYTSVGSSATLIYTAQVSPWTYNLPATRTALAITAIAGGGAGGVGEVGANGRGGGGGSGGQVTQVYADLPPNPAGRTLEITVGLGGPTSTSGASGAIGDFSRVRSQVVGSGVWDVLAYASGGWGGSSGGTGGAGGDPPPSFLIGNYRGGLGATRNGTTSPASVFAAGGGGAGQSLGTNAGSASAGGGVFTRGIGGTSVGNPGVAWAGGGGGTGGAAGGAGGANGGGGGGGSGRTTSPAGSGGAGGNGLVIIGMW